MISIFISSTFRDMQAERDTLVMDVLPEIEKIAHSYGQSIDFIDLRWGVDTSELENEDGSKKVLSVCLDEIDRSHPYMIVLLGERYGWVPDKNLIYNTTEQKGFKIEDDFKSVTALEIEYGALSNRGQTDRCLFYMREHLPLDHMSQEAKAVYSVESTHHKDKLEALKKKIEEKTGSEIKTYSADWDEENERIINLDQFSKMVISDLKALFENEWKTDASLSLLERETRDAWRSFRDNAAYFSAMHAACEMYKTEILDEQTRLFVLKGKEGAGKSVLLSKIALDFEEQNLLIMPVVCGSGAYSRNSYTIMQQAVAFLEKNLNLQEKSDKEKPLSYNDLRANFSDLVGQYGAEGKSMLIFVIDGLEKLSGENALNFKWLPNFLPSNVKIVCSCAENVLLKLPILLENNTLVRSVEPLSLQERKNMIQGVAATFHKQLHSSIIEKLANLQQADDPLYLTMLLERMLLMDSDDYAEIAKLGNDMNAINQYLTDIIENAPEDVDGLCISILSLAGNRVSQMLSQYIIRYIAISRFGLREGDIKALMTADEICSMAYNALDVSRILKYLRRYLIQQPDGRIDYAHKNIRNGMIKKMSRENYRSFSLDYMHYLKTLPVDDIVKKDDVILHAFRCGDSKAVVDHIAAIDVKKMAAVWAAALEQIKMIATDYANPEFICLMISDYKETAEGMNSTRKLAADIGNHFERSQKEQEVLALLFNELLNALKKQYNTGDCDLALLANLQKKLADTYRNCGELEKAKNILCEGSNELSSLNSPTEAEQSLLVTFYLDLALILKEMGSNKDMLQFGRKALKIQENLAKANESLSNLKKLATSYEMFASALIENAEPDNALEYCQKSIAVREKIFSMEASATVKRNLAIAYDHMAAALSMIGNYAEAITYLQKAMEIRKTSADELRTPDMFRELAISYNSMAGAYIKIAKFGEAEKMLELAKTIFLRLSKDLNTMQARSDEAMYYINTADCLARQDKMKEALESAKKSLSIRKELMDEFSNTSLRQAYETTLASVRGLEKRLSGQIVSQPSAPQQTDELYKRAISAVAMGQSISDKDPAAAKQAYEEGISFAKKAVELQASVRNRDALATSYYFLSFLLKEDHQKQNECWKHFSEIWADIYENANDKQTKQEFKDKYKAAKTFRRMLKWTK